jgi:phosphatidylglycerophosphate synthase
MAFLDGALASLLEWSTVGPALLYIIFPVYILVVYPFMLRSRKQAVLAFKPLLSLEDDAFSKAVENVLKPSRRGEWTAIFLGISILGAVLVQPWTLVWTSGYF